MQPQKEQSQPTPEEPGEHEEPQSGIAKIAEDIQQEVQAARQPRHRVLRQARILLLVYLILLVLFGSLAFWVHFHPILTIDVAITHAFQEDQSPWLSALMFAVSYLGNMEFLFTGLIILTAIIFWALRLRLEALIIVLVSLTSSLLNVLLKLWVARPRPNEPLVSVLQHANGKSFPSGHVMSYMAYWGLLFSLSLLVFKGKSWWRTLLLIISGFFVVLVGPSRIYLGDHWASDVLGAYVIGGLWLWLWLWIYRQLKRRGV